MSTLSTHVLDTMHGRPAAGVELRLLSAAEGVVLYSGTTDADGRCSDLPSVALGNFLIEFSVAAYFRAAGVVLPDPPFIDVVTIAFGIAEADGHYHVPLLLSPFAYSTYRGS